MIDGLADGGDVCLGRVQGEHAAGGEDDAFGGGFPEDA